MNNYIIATVKSWNYAAYHKHAALLPGIWHLVTTPEELNKIIVKVKPKFIFFPHWSWIVPDDLINEYDCVCFHMTDVPYGRGGSPLQNLIARGHKQTKLTALRMVSELDAGPIYLKTNLSLAGTAQEIYESAAEKVYDLIHQIVKEQPKPIEQHGDPFIFERRTPDQSELPNECSLNTLYDHIRMLDAETYPKAFLEYGAFHFIFEAAILKSNNVEAKVIIRKRNKICQK